MKRSLFSPPDMFSQLPLVALLPIVGRVSGLPGLSTSLFARYEKVQNLRKELGSDADKAAFKRLTAEETMLKQVLDWLSANSEGGFQ